MAAVAGAEAAADRAADPVLRAVRALREIGDELVSARSRAAAVAPVAAGLEDLLGRLRETRGEGRPARDTDGLPVAVDRNPNVGLHNHVAPPIRLQAGEEPGVLKAFVRYRACHEGPPGWAHGGQIAAFFDELLLSCQTLDGIGGVTAQLTVRYIRPVPLHTDLAGRAWIDRQDGRKRYIRGKLTDPAGVVLAEAEALALPGV